MRYKPAHAAKSGSVPFTLRGPNSAKKILSAAVAGAIGIVPAVLVSTAAEAAIPGFTFQNPAVSGAEGTALTFTVVQTGAAPLATKTLDWTIVPISAPPGTAEASPDDYGTPTSGTITFPVTAGGDTTTSRNQTIAIQTVDDTMDEDDEQFAIRVSDPLAPANTIEATGTIQDNDAAPTYTFELDNANPGEAAGMVNVTAVLSAKSGKSVAIPISTTDVTAKAGQDYTAVPANTTINVISGATRSAVFPIAITDDLLYEESEQTFTVVGGTAASVTGSKSSTITIQDNEVQSRVTVAPTTAQEGDPLQFPVTLTPASEREVTVSYSTADGPGSDVNATDAAKHGIAKAGEDYTAQASGSVKFPAATSNTPAAASTAQVLSVATINDQLNEVTPEDMNVKLATPTVAALGSNIVATGGIADDDSMPTVSLSPSTYRVPEGNTGKAWQTFTVTLNKASGQKVEVKYQTGGTSNASTGPWAEDGQDYTAATGTLTFAPGEVSKTFSVEVLGDTIYEGDEQFGIWLASSTATIPSALEPVDITITDDDAKPTATIASQTMVEGNGGSVAVFPIKLSNAASTNVVYNVTDVPGTATTSSSAHPAPGVLDYLKPAATAIVPAGQTTGYVYYLVNGDDVFETNETMSLSLTPTGTNIASDVKTASLTITNDDTAPSIEVVSATANEGDKVQVRATTMGVAQDEQWFSVNFKGASVKGSVAASPNDFVDPGAVTVRVYGGTPSGASVEVGNPLEIVDDTDKEPAETILASGTGLGAGKVIDGVITIAASDGGTTPTNPTDPTNDITLMSAASFRLGAGTLKVSGKAAANADLKLWGKAVGAAEDAAWVEVATVKAGADGAYAFNPNFTTTGWWLKVSDGTHESKAIKVNLKEDPDLTLRSSSRGTLTATVVGDPKVRGLAVRLLRGNADGSWTTIGTGILNASGSYSKTVKGTSGRSYLIKALVLGDGERGLLTNYSNSGRVTVR